jgi:hypothetical protein
MAHSAIDFTPQIVGHHNGAHVAFPIELPPPRIYPAKLLEKDVRILDPQQFIRSNCLVISPSVIPLLHNSSNSSSSSSPAAISLTNSNIEFAKNTLKLPDRFDPNSLIYELEMFPFKTPPHADLYRGWVLLKKHQRGDEFIRTTNQFQIIVKKFKKAMADAGNTADNVISEFSVLQYLGTNRCPHVSGQIICLTDGMFYYSVMKFCGYDLGSYVFREERPLREECVRHLFRQLLAGMRFLQSYGVCHRDLSVENLIYDEETQILSIVDYGMSLVLPRHPDGQPYLIPPSGPLGKKHYIPPEILENTNPFNGFLSDSWNLGIILFLVLTKKYPMKFANLLCPYFKIVSAGKLRSLLEHWNLGLSAEAMDLLCRLLQPIPNQRYSLEDISNHPWVIGGVEIPVRATPPAAAVATPAERRDEGENKEEEKATVESQPRGDFNNT